MQRLTIDFNDYGMVSKECVLYIYEELNIPARKFAELTHLHLSSFYCLLQIYDIMPRTGRSKLLSKDVLDRIDFQVVR